MPYELTFSNVWVRRLGVVIALKTIITDVARRPYLVNILNTDLMLTTTTADTAYKPDPHITYRHQQQQQYVKTTPCSRMDFPGHVITVCLNIAVVKA